MVSLSMGTIPPAIVVVLWFVKIAVVLVFLHKRRLLGAARKQKKNGENLPSEFSFPMICVQLPLFNEPGHVVSLIEKISELDWPDSRLEVQVLDDSTDETEGLAKGAIQKARMRRPGLALHHIHRKQRSGYKAGALNHGLGLSNAKYFAIFDCDFRPEKDFLKKMMPHFLNSSSKVACVQAGWTYYNGNESLFTQSQSLLLNTHFYMEHAGRSALDYVFNFNGTAGIWKREALVDLGGWSDHSVTEDLYLSYKAYSKNWRMVFSANTQCSSELPSDLASFLVQQRRWAKGNGQVLRLLGTSLLQMKKWGIAKRLDVSAHLLGYGLTTLVLLMLVLAPVWIQARADWVKLSHFFDIWRVIDQGIWVILWGSLFSVYASRAAQFGSRVVNLQERLTRALFLLFIAPCLSVLLCHSYWQGVLLPARGKQLIFHRTPKSKKSNRTSLAVTDHLTVGALVIGSAFLSKFSFEAGFYLGSIIFGGQFICIFYLWFCFGLIPSRQFLFSRARQYKASAL